MIRSRRLGTPVHRFASLDSTMIEAQRLAESGAVEGALVIAETQTAGRGRLGRDWVSEPGVGLYFSLVLRPNVTAARLPILTLAVGLGVAEGIEQACRVECDLRWPNDVLLNEMKCAGILVETLSADCGTLYAIVGVGVNVNQVTMPDELADIATSARIETGCEYDREEVLHQAIQGIERYYGIFLDEGAEAIVPVFALKSSYVRDRRVAVLNGSSETLGTTAGLDPHGVLLLQTDEGHVEPILAGSVRPIEGR